MKSYFSMIAIVMLCVGTMMWTGCKPKELPPPPPPVTVQVSTTPEGATIYVNGAKEGKSPCDVRLTLGDNVLITALAPGHRYFMHLIPRVTQNTPRHLNCILVPLEGIILVQTEPKGARIFLDNSEKGTTPASLTGLTTGYHDLRVEMSGYGKREQRVFIDEECAPQLIQYKLASRMGRVVVKSRTESVNLTIDNQPRGLLPWEGELEEGKHTLIFTKQGYRDVVETLMVRPNETVEKVTDLAEIPGKLIIATQPAGAQVVVDEKPYGVTPVEIPNISVGTHQIKITCDGFDPITEEVRLTPGEELPLNYDLTTNRGDIEINSAPGGLIVMLDGKRYGVTEIDPENRMRARPFLIKNLPMGTHSLSLVAITENGQVKTDAEIEVPRGTKGSTQLLQLWVKNVRVKTTRATYTGFLKSYEKGEIKLEREKGITQKFKKSDIVDIQFLKLTDE